MRESQARTTILECMRIELAGVVAVYDFRKHLQGSTIDISYWRTDLEPAKVGDNIITVCRQTRVERKYATEKRFVFMDCIDKDYTMDIEKLRLFFAGQKEALRRLMQCPTAHDWYQDPFNACLGIEIGPFTKFGDIAGRELTFVTANLPFTVTEILELLREYESARAWEEHRRL